MPQKQKKKGKKKQRRSLRRAGMALAVLLLVGLAAVSYSYFSLRAPGDLPKPPLKDLAAARGVELGMLTQPSRLDHGPYRQLLTSEFSLITSDGEVHWDKFEPSPGTYDFSKLDAVLEFAEANRMPVQVHHLIWNEDDSLPKWLKEGGYTQQELLQLIEVHIKTLVGRYKGRVAEWTVVNEPFTRERNLWNTDNWLADQLKGTGYIDKAFRWAHEADPDAKLILNDFYNETKTFASDAQYEYMKGAKARGVPIDGVGMQMHLDAARPPDRAEMIENMRRFGELGYPVYVTEFDINTTTVEGTDEYKERLEDKLAADAIAACVESRSCVSFTVFGLTDRNYFVEQFEYGRQRQYLFTSRYQPKSAFHAFRAALLGPQGTQR